MWPSVSTQMITAISNQWENGSTRWWRELESEVHLSSTIHSGSEIHQEMRSHGYTAHWIQMQLHLWLILWRFTVLIGTLNVQAGWYHQMSSRRGLDGSMWSMALWILEMMFSTVPLTWCHTWESMKQSVQSPTWGSVATIEWWLSQNGLSWNLCFVHTVILNWFYTTILTWTLIGIQMATASHGIERSSRESTDWRWLIRMRCKRCGKKLSNSKSLRRGFGPVCWRFISKLQFESENWGSWNQIVTNLLSVIIRDWNSNDIRESLNRICKLMIHNLVDFF